MAATAKQQSELGIDSGLAAFAALDQLFAFRIGCSYLAVPVESVLHVDAIQPAVPLARAPAWIAGLVPVPSGAVPLMELERFVPLGHVLAVESRPRAEVDELPGRVIVVQESSMRVGLRCDRVVGVVAVPPKGAEGATRGQRLSEFVEAEYEQPYGLLLRLNLEKLLMAARAR